MQKTGTNSERNSVWDCKSLRHQQGFFWGAAEQLLQVVTPSTLTLAGFCSDGGVQGAWLNLGKVEFKKVKM